MADDVAGGGGVACFDGVSKAVRGRPFISLLRYNLPYWRRYVVGAVFALFFMAVELLMPLIMRAIVAGFENARITWAGLLLFFFGLIVVAGVSGIARYFQRMLMIGASRDFEYDLRNDYFRHIQRMSPRFFRHTTTGDIMARATNDLNYVRDFIGPGVMGTVDMIRIPFTLGLMMYLSVRLTLVSLVPLPVISVLVYVFVRFMNRQSKIVQELFSTVTSHVQENLAGSRVVKAYGVADRQLALFRSASEQYMRANIKLVMIMSIAWPMIGVVVGGTILLIMWQGGGMVIQGGLTLADLTAFMVCVIMLAWPLAQFGWVLTLYQRGAVSMNRISEILNAGTDIADGEQTRADAAVIRGGIRFENVSFAYDGVPVLHDIDFEIPPGRTVAIVGPTGSGKTTLMALLTREYDPTSGRILIDGQDLRSIPLEPLRRAIGYVPQDTFIFSESIRENLRLGRPAAGDAALRRACETAQFTEVLEETPAGLAALLGERGINLSGGQKQRLAIARAILCDPAILILDDALSSVDTHTEERILEGLSRVMAARTSIIISHRVSTVRHADQILVMDEGRIVERGRHEDLLSLNGIYAGMHRRQLLEAALEEES